MPARVVVLVVLGLAVASAGGYVFWTHRPAGVFALRERPPPAPPCRFTVQLDRESMKKQPVQFGDLDCGHGLDPVLRIGGRWFTLPATSAGSRYGTVRRSDSDLAWVVGADTDFFRSDDGGETFALLHLPRWGELEVLPDVAVKGQALEHLMFTIHEKVPLPARLKRVWDEGGTLGERWQGARAAWSGGGYWPSTTETWRSSDGGRTWTR